MYHNCVLVLEDLLHGAYKHLYHNYSKDPSGFRCGSEASLKAPPPHKGQSHLAFDLHKTELHTQRWFNSPSSGAPVLVKPRLEPLYI